VKGRAVLGVTTESDEGWDPGDYLVKKFYELVIAYPGFFPEAFSRDPVIFFNYHIVDCEKM
jgi:hypothetical protein